MNYLSVLNKDLYLDNSISFGQKFIYFNRECNLKHWNSYFDKENKIQLRGVKASAIVMGLDVEKQ